MYYFAIVIPIIALLAWIIFRKKSKPVVGPLPVLDSKYLALLDTHINYYHKLDAVAKKRFEAQIAHFFGYVHLEGVGTTLTDTDRVMIAASAVIPIFGLGNWQYNNLTNVILYPDTFDNDYQFEGNERSIMGMVGSGYMNGQMLLSRAALTKGFSAAAGKENTGIHEFVHLLDKADGATDGVPEQLIPHEYALPWLNMMHQEMRRIEDGHSDINPYALTNEAEFLAVASEYFFEKPDQFQHKHPELYQHLSRIFKQEPADGFSL
jgi:Mlc titration factor MtfA (ptsG expression regulator)